MTVCASNPLSTKDDVAAALVALDGVATFARHGEAPAVYAAHLDAVLDRRPALTIDDGCDLDRPAPPRAAGAGCRDPRRDGGHDDGRPPAPGHRRQRLARLSRRGGERRRDPPPGRQPLRDRPVDDGRDHEGDERPHRRHDGRRRRLRELRSRHRRPCPRPRGDRHRDRDRPDEGARGGPRRLQGHADVSKPSGKARSS